MTEATRVDRLRLSKFERNIDLDLMARAAHQLKDGGSHGPYLSGYTVMARVLALMSVAAAGVGVVGYVGPEPGVWLTVAGLVVISMALSFDEGSLIPNTPYSEGQRVSREKDILNPNDGLKIGVVTRLYASEARHDRRFRYSEMYEVTWADGSVDSGYLRHGLTPIQ